MGASLAAGETGKPLIQGAFTLQASCLPCTRGRRQKISFELSLISYVLPTEGTRHADSERGNTLCSLVMRVTGDGTGCVSASCAASHTSSQLHPTLLYEVEATR